LVGKMSTVMEKLRAKTQYQLAICDLGFSGLVNPKIVNRLSDPVFGPVVLFGQGGSERISSVTRPWHCRR